MIKLLSIFGAVGMSAGALPAVVSCGASQTTTEPIASSVNEEGILTSDFKMKLKKDSVSFSPLSSITQPDDSEVFLSGLALINSDIDGQIKSNTLVTNEIPAIFSVKYKDIKENLNPTRNKLTRDLKVNVHLTSNVRHLQSPTRPTTIIVNVANTYDGRISGNTLPIVVDLPQLKATPVPDVQPTPVRPDPVLPQPTPDKPDHYVPDSPDNYVPDTNKSIGLKSAVMNENGGIITINLTGLPKSPIKKSQIVLTDKFGQRIDVYAVLSDSNDPEVLVVLEHPVSGQEKLTIAILHIAEQNGLVNCLPVDMSCDQYNPSYWPTWESVWSLTKQACYYGYKAGVISFKLSVQLAWLLCPCQWPAVCVMTACDVLWAIR